MIPYPTIDGSKSKSSTPAAKPSTPVPQPADSATAQQVLDLLPELHKNTIKLYQRAANFPGESIPNISFCETILRHAKALTSQYLANGVAKDAIAHIVSSTPISHKGPKKNVPSRIDISEVAMQAYPQPVEFMTVLEATKVLSGIASIHGAIGMKRRKAFVTRELLKILIPGLIQARVVGAAEMGIHPAAGLSALSGGSGSPLDLGEGDVESGIMEMLEELCRAYGCLAGLGDEKKLKEEEQQRAVSSNAVTLETSVWTKAVIAEQDIRMFGWPALKFQVLRNCTALCEALPDFQGVLNFTTLLLTTTDEDVIKEDQARLSTTISRTVGAARKLGIPGVEANYWDQFLLRDIELVENPTWRPPIPRNKTELVDPDSLLSPTTMDDKTPFLYNPFKVSESSTAENILVLGEPAELKLTVQNPFNFDVEVEWVRLDTSGVALSAQPVGVIIGPSRTHQVSVFATPNDIGEVKILGCTIKVYGCKERFFPILTSGIDMRQNDTKCKRFGLKALEPKVERPLSTISTSGRGPLRPPPILHPIPKTLQLTVVDSQPLLVVRNTSLSQSALMVLEGERRIFQITLRNLSNVDVDHLYFDFTDSTTARIRQALAEKTNSPAETYELELMLKKKRAFAWHRQNRVISASENAGGQKIRPQISTQDLTKKKVYIPAAGDATFEIEVLGKPGLTHGTILADYSHLGLPPTELGNRYFTRQVVYPVTVTVNASIELARVDFIPFSTDFPIELGGATFGPFKQLFSRGTTTAQPGDYCLMLLDLRNAWPQPLKVKLALRDAVDSDEEAFVAEDLLQAGHTSRLTLPVKRIFLPRPYAPIPSISTTQRQFVVSTTRISVDQERQGREAFWYREELLKRLTGTWEEVGTSRRGDVELRGIRLSPRMVETVRVEEIGVAITVEGDDETVNRMSPARSVVATDAFLTLSTTITNRTNRPVRLILRLLPALRNIPPPYSFDLGRRMAINGLLQQALPLLAPGESSVVRTGFTVLAKGEYEVSASVEDVLGLGGKVVVQEAGGVVEGLDKEGRPLDVLADAVGGAGRRCWVCREVCGIVARDVL